MKTVRIILAIVGVLALAAIVYTLIPGNGNGIAVTNSEVSFAESGDEMHVFATIENKSNKIAFLVGYKITLDNENGERVADYKKMAKVLLLPGHTIELDNVVVPFNTFCDRGDYELNTTGYVFN